MLAGGCHCGAVRYRTAGPVTHETLCHCADCRRISGAPVVAWITVPLANIAFEGDWATYRSSEGATRRFCPRCGTPLSFHTAADPDMLDLTTATLDDPALAPPRDQNWTRSALPWTGQMLATPAFEQTRTA